MKNPRPEHIFSCKWKFLHTEVLQLDQDWKLFPEFQLPLQIWTFYVAPLDFIYKREENMNGFLLPEQKLFPLPFIYDCHRDILVIDRSGYETEGFLSRSMEDVFRLEMIDQGNLYLYWESLADREELVDCIRTQVNLFV